jgi:crossover junction endodeoxyribonuclease RusA
VIQFTAYGVPAPKGSMKAFYRPGMRFPVVTEANKNTRPWAAIVKDAAMQIIGDCAVPTGAVCLKIAFFMPRPKSLPKKVIHHLKKPDCDKLIRAVKDALTGVLWRDDSQVVSVRAVKLYVENGAMPRAEIGIEYP